MMSYEKGESPQYEHNVTIWKGSFSAVIFVSAIVSSCISNDDKCGDMMVYSGKAYNTYDMCTPYPDSDSELIPPISSDPGNMNDAGDADASDSEENTACESAADCSDGEYCDLTLSPPICLPPPTGQGMPCASQADCADYDANYCETLVSMTCLVADCSPEISNCSEGWHCCDFAAYGLPPLCINTELSGGTCVK